MSDTPRTDKEIVGELLVFASFARKLERELAAMTEQRDEYKGLLIELHNDINIIHSGNAIAKLNKMFKEENHN